MSSGISTAASSRGSVTVEAAVVFPVMILIVAGGIYLSLDMLAEVREACERYMLEAAKWLTETKVYPEDLLRGRLMLR